MSDYRKQAWGSEILDDTLVKDLKAAVQDWGVRARAARVTVPRDSVQPYPEDGLDVSDWATNNQVYSKPDNSVVTKADIAIGQEVEAFLKEHTPDIPVINEESPEALARYQAACAKAKAEGRAGPTFWTIDPIDGTSNYATTDRNSDNYAVMLGLVEDGKPTFGMNYYPQLGKDGEGLLVYTDRTMQGGKTHNRQLKWGEYDEGMYMERTLLHPPSRYEEARGDALRITPNTKNVFDRDPDLAERILQGRETEVTDAPYQSTLHMLQKDGAHLGAHWGLAAVWDVVPYMALCNAQGIATVMAEDARKHADGSLDFATLPEDLKPGAYFEGLPDTLKQLGVMNEAEHAVHQEAQRVR